MANPLTARHGIAHGQAVGMVLPIVVRFNAGEPGAAEEYARLAATAGLASWNGEVREPVESLVGFLRSTLSACEMPSSLTACDVPASATRDLAEEAARQWTAQFNPRTVTANDFEQLYRSVL